MVKKSALLKKLSSYSALASVAIATAQTADGQIIYHSMTPDTLTSYSIYDLDLNGDGITDFELVETISHTTSTSGRVLNVAGIGAINAGDSVELDVNKAFNVPMVLPNSYNNLIGAADKWLSSAAGAFDYCTVKNFKNQGVFAGKGYKYAGLKLDSAGIFYYGWVRVYVSSKCDTLIVRDYAYNATPNSSIRAGEGETSGITPLTIEAAVLEPSHPNPATTISNIIYTIPVYSSITITLYDVMGRKIETLLDNAMQSPGRHTIPVDVSKLSSGIYFYELTANGQTYTQKVAVTH